tara:strand:+ start:3042 stop:3602 length:561 start_codon:yes stop_codon:yes gene_type:complete
MKLEINQIGMGCVAAENSEVGLVGGIRSGGSSEGLTRRKYVIFDSQRWSQMAKEGAEHKVMEKACNVGFIELLVKDGEEDTLGVTGVANIQIKPKERDNGIGRKVINAIRETTGQALEIHDIKKHRAGVWKKLGVTEFHNGEGRPVQVSKQHADLLLYGTMPPIGQEPEVKAKKRRTYESDDGMSP